MTKYLSILAAAAMLAGCARTEVILPRESEAAEITFTAAPLTKGLAAGQQSFSTSNVFQTLAWYTTGDFDYSGGEQYVPASMVSYSTADGSWRTATPYYWPKDGGVLSFFSWSLNRSSLTFRDRSLSPSVSFSTSEGITLSGYSSAKNDDFMVADPALSRSGNASTYEHSGVPTLFRHKTAKLLFKVKAAKDYSGRSFTLTGISLANLSTSGTYVQCSSTSSLSELWTPDAGTATLTYYSSTSGLTLSTAEQNIPTTGATYLFIPQSFSEGDGKSLTVNYTWNNTTTGTSTAKTATISMNSLLGGDAATSTAFGIGKIYTVTLTFTAGEILWNPQVMDWDTTEKEISVTY